MLFDIVYFCLLHRTYCCVVLCIRPSIVLFSYSAFGCKSVLLNQFNSVQLIFMRYKQKYRTTMKNNTAEDCTASVDTATNVITLFFLDML